MSLARHLNFQGCIKGQLNPLQLKGIQKLLELKHSQSITHVWSGAKMERHLEFRFKDYFTNCR